MAVTSQSEDPAEADADGAVQEEATMASRPEPPPQAVESAIAQGK